MIIPDVQLIVHAHNPGVPEHDVCRAWWETLLNGKRKWASLTLFSLPSSA
jgi:predicted nucleic acid-binding protein